MALKDITLGQYFPGHSFIHRLDPRAKIIFTVVYIVAIFLCKALVSYGLALVVLLLLIAISRVQPKVFLKGMKPVIFIVICTALLNLFYTSGTVLWSFGILKITEEGIWKAGFMVLRILMLIRFPVHELSMMMSIALRFIPTLIQETDKIISAQKARGADFDSGNLMQKAKALIPILIPLFLSSFRRAEELAIAMECRCYHGDEGRTSLRQLTMHGRDWGVVVFSVLLCAARVVLRCFGL